MDSQNLLNYEDLTYLLDTILSTTHKAGGLILGPVLEESFNEINRKSFHNIDPSLGFNVNNERVTFKGILLYLQEEGLLLLPNMKIGSTGFVSITIKGILKLAMGGFTQSYKDQLKLIDLSQLSYNALSEQLKKADDQIGYLHSQLDNSTTQLQALTTMSNNADSSSKQAIKYSIWALIITGIMGIGGIVVGIQSIIVSSTESKQSDQIMQIDSLIIEQKRNRDFLDSLYRLSSKNYSTTLKE